MQQRPTAASLAAGLPRLRLPLPLAVLAGCFALVALSTGRLVALDTYFDLYAGRFVAAHGLPATDPFTVAGHGRAWVDQQWLAHLAYYGAWRLGGYALLGALAALLVGSAFALVAALARRRGAGPGATALTVALAALAGVPAAIVWAQDFAYPLFAATLWLLVTAGPRRRLLLLPLLVLWANLHGSVLVGCALATCAAGLAVGRSLARRERPGASDLALLVLAPLAPLATPYGPAATLAYYRSVLGNHVLPRELELWQHASPADAGSVAFGLLALAATGLVALAYRRGARPSTALVALAAVLAVAGVDAVRHQIWFLLAFPLVAAEAATLARIGRIGGAPLRRVLSLLVPTAAVLAGLALVMTSPATYERLEPQAAVEAAARAAQARPGALVLADTASASALLWHHPELAGRVAFDPRVEVFRPGDAESWFAWNASRPGSASLERGYDIVLASRAAHPRLAAALARRPHRRVVWSGPAGVVTLPATPR
jgi:hypothetical protein